MKLYNYLPDQITEKNTTFKMLLGFSHIAKNADLKRLANGKKFRTVHVLAKNLRGKTDLHGRLYEPSKWLYVEQK